jgi:phytoene synthase
MMAYVMGARDLETLRRACDLGMALQLTNIARDVIEDAKGARVYLPADWLGTAATPAAVANPANRSTVFAATERLLAEAEPYYASARWGLKSLGFRSAWAVAAALAVYRQIGLKVRAMGPTGMDRRASTGKAAKLALVLQGGIIAVRAAALDGKRHEPARAGLWAPF